MLALAPTSGVGEQLVAVLPDRDAGSELATAGEVFLEDLEDDEVDIDVLATKVERAAALVELCRGKISSAKVQVERIVGELELVAETE